MTPLDFIPTLETERLILRAPAARDHGVLAEFFASDATRYVGSARTSEQTWRYLCEVIGHWHVRGFGRWMVTLRGDDTAIGLVGLHYPMGWPDREIGWYIWNGNGQGYAREAGRAARVHAYETLGWDTAISMIDMGNDASVRVAEALGATRQPDFDYPGHGPVMIYRHPAAQKRVA
ncbi:MAG: GNAT family N-acetyltransferase [Pseudomonadota bacterium]